MQLHGGRQRHGGRGGRRGRPVQYDGRLAEPLQVLWRAAGYCCAELLHAAQERLLQQLMAHGRLVVNATSQPLLLQMSCPALKRYLRRLPNRRVVRRHPRRERRLRLRVPLSISQPTPRAAGTFACGLVEHNGSSSAVAYISTVHVVERNGRCTARARARGERRHERAAPSLHLSSSLRGSAQARYSKRKPAAAFWYTNEDPSRRAPPC